MKIHELSRQVHLYETDLMGIVHHSNYLRYMEEGRTQFAYALGFDLTTPGVDQLAVHEIRTKYLKPLRFGDSFQIRTRARSEGVRVYFQYQFVKGPQTLFAGESVHVLVDKNMKLKRLPSEYVEKIGEEKWTETWL